MPHITGQPVRRHSRQRGRCEPWRPTDRRTVQRIVLAARRFELARKGWGRRNGPLGYIALEVLGLMANVVDFRSGRLEPSITWIMGKLRRSRDAVVRALKALKRHGFLDWLRRFEPTGNAIGPQVRQVSNAYRLALPAAGAQALERYGPAPMPDDAESALAARSMAIGAYERDAFTNSPLGQALDRLRGLIVTENIISENIISERESAKRTEPSSGLLVRGKRDAASA